MRFKYFGVPVALIGLTLSLGAQNVNQTAKKTVWNGVYTDAQMARGKMEYQANCGRCHGETLEGSVGRSLQGRDFMERWREDDAESLFLFMKASMPPNRNRNVRRVPLPDQVYVDILSYVFMANTFPAGATELTLAELPNIRVEGRDGPRPLPHGALAQVVGCMTKDGTNWFVMKATEPVRTRLGEMATVEEIQTATAKPAGSLEFRLENFGYLGADFSPERYQGQRVLVKGTLVRQQSAERINITSLTTVAETCSQ